MAVPVAVLSTVRPPDGEVMSMEPDRFVVPKPRIFAVPIVMTFELAEAKLFVLRAVLPVG